MTIAIERTLGVHSEVGNLRTVVVHAPDPALGDARAARSTQRGFERFVELLRGHGIEVLVLRDLLSEALEAGDARAWLLSRRLCGAAGFACELREWLMAMESSELAASLTRGLTVRDLPRGLRPATVRRLRAGDFVLAPLPNQLFTRDTSAWVYGGVVLSAFDWPARRYEALNAEAVYRFHPRFRGAGFPFWYGGFDQDAGAASIEGGDVLSPGDGVVVVGIGERTTPPAAARLARTLYAAGAARLVIGARMPRERAAIRLDAVMAFCDRNLVAVCEPVVAGIVPILYLPAGDDGVRAVPSERSLLDEVQEALGLSALRVVATGGDHLAGGGIVALAPGVVMAFDHDEVANARLAQHGIEVHTIARPQLGRGRGIACPIAREP